MRRTLVAGDILLRDTGAVRPNQTTLHLASPQAQSLWETTGLAVGNGIELGLAIHETPTSALFVQTTPVFLIGSRDIAVTLPIGLSYRFF